MTNRPAYQLTKYPVGSLAEIWTVSWPLMLGLCSSSVMMFVDRLYLAHFSVTAMNAMAQGGLAAFLFLIFPFSLCQITEVFVGKYHGKEQNEAVGKPVWQILWISLAMWPMLGLASRLLAHVVFAPDSLESAYFVTLLDFCPFLMISVGIMGFFIGIGNTRIITYASILSNLVNILLAPLFIYGSAYTPAWGIQGAAVATGVAHGFQVLLLFAIFLKKNYQTRFETQKICFDRKLIKEMLELAVPSGVGRLVEIFAIVVFYRIIALAGINALTCATMVQSFYLLTVFCVDGIAKGVTTVIANLVGAKMNHLIPKAIFSALKVHTLVTLVIGMLCFGFCRLVFSVILQEPESELLNDASFVLSLQVALGWMCLYFLLDGFSWIVSGHLMALGESKYIMYMSSSVHWFTYVLPTYFLITQSNCGTATGWGLLTFDGLVMTLLFSLRSRKLTKLAQTNPLQLSNNAHQMS